MIVIKFLKLRLARAVVDGREGLVLALLLSAVVLRCEAVTFLVSPGINGPKLGRVIELLLDQHLVLVHTLWSSGLCHRLIVAVLVNVELVRAPTDDSDVVRLAAQVAAGVGLLRGELHQAAPICLLLRPVLRIIFYLLTGGCAAGRILSRRCHVCLVL